MTDAPGPSAPGPVAEAPTPPPASPLADAFTAAADWPAKAADSVDLIVAVVTDKAVRPVVVAARALVFGLIMATMATVATVALTVALVRLFDVYVFPGRIWLTYLVLGAVATAAGLLCFTRRVQRRLTGR